MIRRRPRRPPTIPSSTSPLPIPTYRRLLLRLRRRTCSAPSTARSRRSSLRRTPPSTPSRRARWTTSYSRTTWSSADLAAAEDNFAVKTFQGDDFLIDKKGNGELEIKDGIKETADFKEVDILTCQGYLHVIDKVLFYDDAGGSDGALGKAVGVAAGAVALGAALL